MKKSKEVIFGIFFLLAMGVVFVPMLFLKHDSQQNLLKDLPRSDFFKEKPKALNPPNALLSFKNTLNDNIKTEDHEVKGYLVEIEIFKSLKEAKTLIQKLQKSGYPAFISHKNTSGKDYKVAIGPHLKKEDAVKLKTTLEAKFNLKGNVMNYVPTDIMKEST